MVAGVVKEAEARNRMKEIFMSGSVGRPTRTRVKAKGARPKAKFIVELVSCGCLDGR